MIDELLIEELNNAVDKIGGVWRLPDAEANSCIQLLLETFAKSSTHGWRWEALSVPSSRLSYGSNDGLCCLLNLVQSEPAAVLVVTDDSDPPWVVYEGAPKAIIDILRECRFFEYAIAAPDASWIIFDTHLNELVIAGRLMRQARKRTRTPIDLQCLDSEGSTMTRAESVRYRIRTPARQSFVKPIFCDSELRI